MIYRFGEKTCLNGWWDFKPEYEETEREDRVPLQGFGQGNYLVPSFYNRPWDAVKFPGESYYHPVKERSGETAREDADVLFEAYGYPAAWSAARAAWVKRTVHVAKRVGKRYFIVAEAAGPRATLYINGAPVSQFRDYTLPFITDVTDALEDGENSLAFLLSDYDYEDEEKRRTLWPSGGWTPYSMRGLWQDVYLVEKGEVYVDDVMIRTSVRQGKLTAFIRVMNTAKRFFSGSIHVAVSSWKQEGIVWKENIENVCLKPDEEKTYVLERPWADASLWEPDSPVLYAMSVDLTENGESVDTACERFGFREVWLEGIDLMLNGHPVHLFSDWGHKTSPFQYTEGWIRQWFQMIRDYNMNHARLHTGPHPSLILDTADETGIMITGETALHGSACEQGAGAEIFWERAMSHVKRFIDRDKNHPCLVLWSCENEMRWNTPTPESKTLVLQNLPRIRKLFEKLDPTRPAYHEGDTTCFNERELSILSRHYGREITGMAWWDKTRPLHSGEFGLYHLAGPNNTLQFGGDLVFAQQDYVNQYAVEETLKNSLDARVNGVICLGPWNFSCLVNRREHDFVRFEYTDWNTPGMKPLYAKANTSEFRFWEAGKGYTMAPMTERIPFIFRPFAAVDLSWRTSFWGNEPIEKKVYFVNDLPRDVQAKVQVSLHGEKTTVSVQKEISVKRGRVVSETFDLTGSYVDEGRHVLEIQVVENGQIIDQWEKPLYLSNKIACLYRGNVAVLGDGSSEPLLKKIGVRYERVDKVPNAAEYQVLLLERGTVQPGTGIKKQLRVFCAAGGRVVLLEQMHSVFDGVALSEKSLQTSFFRTGSSLLEGIHEAELAYWDDSAYSAQKKETYVAERFYMKDDGSALRAITDAGEGSFGDGDLERAPLVEAEEGRGLIIACQYTVSSHFGLIPAAARLVANMIDRAAQYHPPEPVQPLWLDDPGKLNEGLAAVKRGSDAVVFGLSASLAEMLSQHTGIKLELVAEAEGTFNCVRIPGQMAIDGISNADLSGIVRYNYVSNGHNWRIADYVLRQTEGLEPLVVTCPESCLRPFYEYGGSSEILRVYTATKYCAHKCEETFVVAGRIAYGLGHIYISLFRCPEGAPLRLKRLNNLLLRNLYALPGGSLLKEDFLTASSGYSMGYPGVVFCYANGEEAEKLNDYCNFQNEHINPRPLLETYPFTRVKIKDGILRRADVNNTKECVIYYTLESATSRKMEKNDLALPDPTAETFLDLSGQGQVDVWVNRRLAAQGCLDDGSITAADVEIENGFNHILIRWRSENEKAQLKMQWRNIMHEAETGFRF